MEKKISKLLLENGANTDFHDTSGLTALMISSLLGYFNIVQLPGLEEGKFEWSGHTCMWEIKKPIFNQKCPLILGCTDVLYYKQSSCFNFRIKGGSLEPLKRTCLVFVYDDPSESCQVVRLWVWPDWPDHFLWPWLLIVEYHARVDLKQKDGGSAVMIVSQKRTF